MRTTREIQSIIDNGVIPALVRLIKSPITEVSKEVKTPGINLSFSGNRGN